MFLCEVDNAHKPMFCKAVAALALLSDTVCFTVAPTGLTLSALNLAQTLSGEVHLDRGFFKRYVLPPAAQLFTVSARMLTVVFRHLDAQVEFIALRDLVSPPDRLRCDIRTANLVRRQYSWSTTPVELPRVNMGKDVVEQSRLQHDAEQVHTLRMEPPFARRFLERVPAATADMAVEVAAGKLQFHGFTQAVMREREYLRQPMSIALTQAVHDTVGHNASDNTEYKAVVRLRDFRTFMSLTTAPVSSSDSSAERLCFDVLVPVAGLPVVFQAAKHEAVRVRFVLVADGGREVLPAAVRASPASLFAEVRPSKRRHVGGRVPLVVSSGLNPTERLQSELAEGEEPLFVEAVAWDREAPLYTEAPAPELPAELPEESPAAPPAEPLPARTPPPPSQFGPTQPHRVRGLFD